MHKCNVQVMKSSGPWFIPDPHHPELGQISQGEQHIPIKIPCTSHGSLSSSLGVPMTLMDLILGQMTHRVQKSTILRVFKEICGWRSEKGPNGAAVSSS